MKDIQKGDKVSWNTPQGKTTGTVTQKLTSPSKIQGHKVAATNDNPELKVKSSKTGKVAAHKPDSLNKTK